MDALLAWAEKPGPLQAAAHQAVVHGYRVLGDQAAALQAATDLYQRYPETAYAAFGRKAALYLLWELGRTADVAALRATLTPRDEGEAAELVLMESLLTGEAGSPPALSQKTGPAAEDGAALPWDPQVVVVPNPYDLSAARQDPAWQLQFVNLPAQARIQIYNVAGARVRTFTHQAGVDPADSGVLEVPAGVYLYVVEELDGTAGSPTGKRATGKFVVIQ